MGRRSKPFKKIHLILFVNALFLAIITFVIVSNLLSNDASKQGSTKPIVKEEKVSSEDIKTNSTPSPVPVNELSSHKKEKLSIKELMSLSKKESEKCVRTLSKVLKGYEFIDPSHEVYSKNKELLKTVQLIVTNALIRNTFELDAFYLIQNKQVKNELKLEKTLDAYNKIPTCRQDKGVLFAETLMEFMVQKKFNHHQMLIYIKAIFDPFVAQLDHFAHPDDHILFYTLTLKASALGIFESFYQNEINQRLDIILQERSELSEVMSSNVNESTKRKYFLTQVKSWRSKGDEVSRFYRQLLSSIP